MLHMFHDIKSLLKLQSVSVDNNIFRLHYQVTLIALLICSVIVNSRQYFGDPIDCTSNSDNAHLMDNYCWIHAFVTTGPLVAVRVNPSLTIWEEKERIYQSYYQWVGFVLFFQAIFFYFPRYLWKHCWEEGRINGLVRDLQGPFIDEDTRKSKTKHILLYFTKNLGTHNCYFLRYVFCELLNLVNVLCQMFVMNSFLGKEFTIYGLQIIKVMNDIPEKRNDPMNQIFPKVVQCEFTKIGDAGNARPFDSICVLPVNIFNEKIYIFLWFWFVLLGVVTCIGLLYRLLTICIPPLRTYILLRKAKSTDSAAIKRMFHRCGMGDWFLWYQIGKNVDPLIFGEILQECGEKMGSLERNNRQKILLLH